MTPRRDQKQHSIHGLIGETFEQRPKLQESWEAGARRRDLAMALVDLRKRAGLTQKQVAAALRWDQAQVSRMESATGPFPDARNVERYAQACGAEAGYVFADLSSGRRAVLSTVGFGDTDAAEAIANLVRAEDTKYVK